MTSDSNGIAETNGNHEMTVNGKCNTSSTASNETADLVINRLKIKNQNGSSHNLLLNCKFYINKN